MPFSAEQTAILLMAYGTPGSESEVEPYLTDIRRGRKPTQDQVEDLKRRYRVIGGHSPFLEITRTQASELEKLLRLKGVNVRVFQAMKHWHPYIRETIPEILNLGIRKIVGIVLAPHYSKMSLGGYRDLLQSALRNLQDVSVDFVQSWYDNPLFHTAVATKIANASTKFPSNAVVSVIFSAHSLPERIVAEGDPYPQQLLESCKTVAKLAKIERWSFAYQSASHTCEKWLGPDILDALKLIPAKSNVLLVPIGFVADHLEILYDIDVEAQTVAHSLGINLQRTESLNADPKFILALADIASKILFPTN